MDNMDKDNLVWANSKKLQDSPDEVFYEKKYLYQIDTNGSSNYTRNEVEFQTTSWSNSGKFIDLKEGVVVIPLLFKVESNVNLNSISDASGNPSPFDLKLKLKSDNLNIINSAMIEYNNEQIVQSNPEITSYLQFLKNTTSSFDDTKLMDFTGIRDTTAYDWYWDGEDGVHFPTEEFDKINFPFYENGSKNKDVIFGTTSHSSGVNFVNRSSSAVHYYYYNCFIRLKDLPFFSSMPLSRGANLRMLFTLNQMEMTLTRKSSGIIKSITKKGNSCPFLLDPQKINDLLFNNDDYVKVTCSVGQLDDNHKHAINQCRLYAPAYTLSPFVKKELELSPQRHLVYNDVHMNHIRKVETGSFNILLTNSITRLKRLIIVPYLNQSGSLGWSSVESPYCEDGLCHPSAVNITDFNVSVSGVNVYSTSRKFKFETYLDEMNCAFGSESGLENGQSTGLFGMFGYENNQGYIVVDLSRKSPDDETQTVSLEISGTNNTLKSLDFLCYMEIEKDFKIDCMTGEKLS